MVGLIFVVACLLYLGRILAWIWGSKPIELYDVAFLVPILIAVLVFRRRRVRAGPRQSAAVAEVDASDEPILPRKEEKSEPGSDDEDALRRQQEWAVAEYHWWKR